MKRLLILVIMVMMGLLAIGCGPGTIEVDEVDTVEFPDCQEAVTNLFANDCSLTDSQGNELTFAEALEGCEEMVATVTEACTTEVRHFLNCILRIGITEDCFSCNDEMYRAFDCMWVPDD